MRDRHGRSSQPAAKRAAAPISPPAHGRLLRAQRQKAASAGEAPPLTLLRAQRRHPSRHGSWQRLVPSRAACSDASASRRYLGCDRGQLKLQRPRSDDQCLFSINPAAIAHGLWALVLPGAAACLSAKSQSRPLRSQRSLCRGFPIRVAHGSRCRVGERVPPCGPVRVEDLYLECLSVTVELHQELQPRSLPGHRDRSLRVG